MTNAVTIEGKRVFLSGPMTGHKHFNVAAFVDAHITLVDAGAKSVYDPALRWLNADTDITARKTHEEYMRESIHMLTAPVGWDVVVLLPGWEDSEGAVHEAAVAEACGIPRVELCEALS